jgi:glycosyltransferase involved in cell wall biosynthesis
MVPVPKVSVVIPTRNRPVPLRNAVISVLAQTLSDLEVIVVVDGENGSETPSLIASFGDGRLRCIALPKSVGGSEARNIGVRHARSKFVALLDDDDEWLPTKLEKQLKKAEEYPKGAAVVVTTQHIHRTSAAPDVVRPRRLPRPNEEITEFMFDYLCYFQTSTFFCSKELIVRQPFASGLPTLQDVDWFLRVMREPRTQLIVVPEPLTIYHSPEGRKTITTGTKWRWVLEWGRANRRHMTRRAYSRFVVGSCVARAAKENAGIRGFATLLYECAVRGLPDPKLICLLCGSFLLKPEFRTKLRDRFMLSRVASPAVVSGAESATANPMFRAEDGVSTPLPNLRKIG